MAGFIRKIEDAFCAVHVLCIVTGVICFIVSIVEVVFYNRWMVEFVSQQHHNTVFAYLQVISYVLVALGLLNLLFRINLRSGIHWCKIVIFLSAAVVIFAGSLFFITRVIMYREEVSRECESYVAEIDRIQQAKTVFCHTYESTYPNMTNSNEDAPRKITQCPNWNSNEMDNKLSRISNDLGCSGWCQQQPIFYFKPNDYWMASQQRWLVIYSAVVSGSCYPKIKTTVDVLTYKMPLAMACIVVLLHMPLLAFLMEAVRQKATD